MIHPFETVLTLGAALLVAGALVVLPKPKPEPPAQQQKPAVEVAMEECSKDPEQICIEAPPVIRAEPLPPKTDLQRAADVEQKLRQADKSIEEIRALIEQQAKAEGSEK